MDHAQIAVNGFDWVQVVSRRSRAGQGCGDLGADQAGLAHAADRYAPGAIQERLDRPNKRLVQQLQHLAQAVTLLGDNAASHREHVDAR